MDSRHPRAEVRIDEDLVRALLAEQHPDLAVHAPVLVDEGWDNVTYRVGADLAIRIPRRQSAVDLLRNEQRWLPVIAPRLDVHVPIPVRAGVPSPLFPWPWSLVRWIPETAADILPLSASQAVRLGGALKALHQAAPPDAPSNPLRGVPLRARADHVEVRLERLDHLPEERLERLRDFWQAGLAARMARDRVWLHGDLHPRNVLVEDGRLVGIIDWGDMAAGDRATDLACAWMFFESAGARAELWEAYGPSRAAVTRARAWAVFFASVLADSGEPRHVGMGRKILENLLCGGTASW